MKKILLPIALCTIQTAFSQTITQADFAVIGDSILIAVDTIPVGFSIGGNGSSQTWDFSTLQVDQSSINKFVDPALTTNGSYFPNSNIAYQTTSTILYIKSQATKVEVVGTNVKFSSTLEIPIQSSDPQKILNFPTNFGDNFMDTTYFQKGLKLSELTSTQIPGVDSVKLVHYGFAYDSINGQGSLSLPGNTFSALRKSKLEFTYDTFYFKMFGNWNLVPNNTFPQIPVNPMIDTIYTYDWYTNLQDFAILTINSDKNKNILRATYLYKNPLAIGLTPTHIDCNGGNTGAVTVNHLSIGLGVPPYSYQWSNAANTQTISGLVAGTYSVTVTDASSNVTSADVVVTQAPALDTNNNIIVYPQTSTSANGSIIIHPAGGTPFTTGSAYTLAWSNSSSNDTIKNLTAGTYVLTITDSKGCTKSFTYPLTAWPTAIETIDEEVVKIFPNPAKDRLTVVNVNNITIHNLLGETILTRKFSDKSSNTINISHLQEGVYFISYKSEDKTYSKKIVVSR